MFNGYIIKFYRHINRKIFEANSSAFDYIAWGSFDDIKITKVTNIVDYQRKNFTDLNGVPKNSLLFRQKLLAYSDDKTDIFETDPKLPLVAIVVVDYKTANSLNIKQYEEYYAGVINNLKITSLKYKILETFTLGRYIVVCRTNSIFNLNVFISSIRRAPLVISSYSVVGLSTVENAIDNWVDNNLKFTIKITTKPNVLPYQIRLSLEEYFDRIIDCCGNKTFKINSIESITHGKYDLFISLETQSKDAFKRLFLPNGIYDLEVQNCKPIIYTKTHFFSELTENTYEIIEETFKNIWPNYLEKINSTEKNYIEDEKKLTQILEEVKKTNLSEDYKYEIERLVYRTIQLIFEYSSKDLYRFANDIVKAVLVFLNMTLETVEFVLSDNSINYLESKEYAYYFNSIIEGTAALNTLIDNRDINDYYDFESPHSNVMFTIPVSKLVHFYSIFSQEILKCLMFLGNKKDIEVFVTVDGCSKITIHQLFSNCTDKMLINIRIPVELLYHPSSTLAFITHELGHFHNATNCTAEKNQYLLLSISQSLCYSLNNSKFKDYDQNSALFFANNYYCSDEFFSKPMEEYIDVVKTNLSNMIHYSMGTQLFENDEKIDAFLDQFYQIIDLIYNGFTEAEADAFMLKILNISDPIKYMEIICHYLNHMSIVDNDLSGNLIMRFVAVLANMIDYSKRINNEKTFREVCINWLDDHILEGDIYFSIFNYFKYMLQQESFCSICYPLYMFLKKFTLNKLGENININLNTEKKYAEILKNYHNLINENDYVLLSQKFIEFVNSLCDNTNQ